MTCGGPIRMKCLSSKKNDAILTIIGGLVRNEVFR